MRVGLYLEPNGEYSFAQEYPVEISKRAANKPLTTAQSAILEMYPYEKSVSLTGNQTRTSQHEIEMILKKNDSVIKGTLKDAAGNSVNIEGYAFTSPAGGADTWQGSEITEGSFYLAVSEGTWDLSYELYTEDYVPSPVEPIQIQVSKQQTVYKNIVLTPMEKAVQGVVNAPDGTPKTDVQVWVQVYGENIDGSLSSVFEEETLSDEDGQFSLSIPMEEVGTRAARQSNYERYRVCVRTAVNLCSGVRTYCYREAKIDCRWRYLNNKKRTDETITLDLRDADTFLEGKVIRNQTPIAGAYVSAYSQDGQKVHAYTDQNGVYQLQVARSDTKEGNTWKISAAYKPGEENIYYRSNETSFQISGTEPTVSVSNLSLNEMEILPGTETYTFNVEKSWTRTLSDGTQIQIPANAMPIQRKETEVKITIEPRVEGLPDNLEYQIVNYGYAVTAREKKSSREILEKFNTEVLFIFRYTDAQLSALGISESDIRPAYFSESANAWQPVKSFTIDKTNNKVSFHAKHFSIWSLVASRFNDQQREPGGPGDINASGAVGFDDVFVGLRIFSHPSLTRVYKEADINGDGKIELSEVIHILKQVRSEKFISFPSSAWERSPRGSASYEKHEAKPYGFSLLIYEKGVIY